MHVFRTIMQDLAMVCIAHANLRINYGLVRHKSCKNLHDLFSLGRPVEMQWHFDVNKNMISDNHTYIVHRYSVIS